VKHHHRPETQQHIALAVMTKEAEQITALIASLRKSAPISTSNAASRCRTEGRSFGVRRHQSDGLPISALEDRVSAISRANQAGPYHTMAHRNALDSGFGRYNRLPDGKLHQILTGNKGPT
jgi:hypothetical protein